MSILDDLGHIQKTDPKGMLKAAEGFHQQLVHARDIAAQTDISALKDKGFAGIAFLGMGGSGFSGDLIKELAQYESAIPIQTVKGYRLPGCVRGDWLTIALSYSGNTEETLQAMEETVRRGCPILCVTSGGRMQEIAAKGGHPCVSVPGGYQPRAASGYLFFPVYLILSMLGLIKVSPIEIEDCLETIRRKTQEYHRKTPAAKNEAKRLAQSIAGTLPLIYGIEGPLATVALRWKCQFNENAKCPSFSHQFPELNHNETVGWERLSELSRQFSLILLTDACEKEVLKKRIQITKGLIQDHFKQVIEIPAEGEHVLSRTLSMMFHGDIASIYLALFHGVDPYGIEKIDRLKAELAKYKK